MLTLAFFYVIGVSHVEATLISVQDLAVTAIQNNLKHKAEEEVIVLPEREQNKLTIESVIQKKHLALQFIVKENMQ